MILKDHHPAKSSSKLFFPDRCNINLRNWQWVQRKMTNNNWLHHQKITMRMPFTWLRPIIRNCNYFLPVSEWLAFCFCSMSNSSLAIIFFHPQVQSQLFCPIPSCLFDFDIRLLCIQFSSPLIISSYHLGIRCTCEAIKNTTVNWMKTEKYKRCNQDQIKH